MLLIADSSVLLNFLNIDRMDLIGSHQPRCAATQEVVAEIQYLHQKERLEKAIGHGHLEVIAVTDPREVELFARLSAGPVRRLGPGERSSIAVALNRGYPLAMDDKRAVGPAQVLAAAESKSLIVYGTQDICLRLIGSGHISIAQADIFLVEWRTQHRFNLPIRSFAELPPA